MNDIEEKKQYYKDCNGFVICYGDILRLKDYKRTSDLAPKEPYFIWTKQGMYVSGMDEFMPIEECKMPTDKIDELSSFEIFVRAKVYNQVQSLFKAEEE